MNKNRDIKDLIDKHTVPSDVDFSLLQDAKAAAAEKFPRRKSGAWQTWKVVLSCCLVCCLVLACVLVPVFRSAGNEKNGAAPPTGGGGGPHEYEEPAGPAKYYSDSDMTLSAAGPLDAVRAEAACDFYCFTEPDVFYNEVYRDAETNALLILRQSLRDGSDASAENVTLNIVFVANGFEPLDKYDVEMPGTTVISGISVGMVRHANDMGLLVTDMKFEAGSVRYFMTVESYGENAGEEYLRKLLEG